MQETQVQSLGQGYPLEEGMATHSSIPAWRISWIEEPGGLQSDKESASKIASFVSDILQPYGL